MSCDQGQDGLAAGVVEGGLCEALEDVGCWGYRGADTDGRAVVWAAGSGESFVAGGAVRGAEVEVVVGGCLFDDGSVGAGLFNALA